MEDFLVTQFLSLNRLVMCIHKISKRFPRKIHTAHNRSLFHSSIRATWVSTSKGEAGTHNFPCISDSSWPQTQNSWTRVCVHKKCVKHSSIEGLTVSTLLLGSSSVWLQAVTNVSEEPTASFFKIWVNQLGNIVLGIRANHDWGYERANGKRWSWKMEGRVLLTGKRINARGKKMGTRG
jgi:hypothetical protein